jgi:23S rRNA-/tRNA-specific pseudouridylate synthase
MILAQGEGWLAVNKPAALTVHNDKGNDLVSMLEQELGEETKVFLINRLDFGTSGIVMIGTSKSSASHIQQQFEKRTVVKTYLAIGQRIKETKTLVNTEGEWKWYLTKRAEGRSNPQGYQKMRVPCKTHWEAKALDEERVFFTLQPLSGRKHQIRRHASLAGWPLLGDDRYGAVIEEGVENPFDRIALHSSKIEFDDPSTGERIVVEAPIDWEQEGFTLASE